MENEGAPRLDFETWVYDLPMTKSLVRYQQAGDLHFITFSCYHRQAYLKNPSTRDLFEQSLETMRLRYDFCVFGYVIMPEHVHLLVSEPRKAILAKALQALKLSVAMQRQERPFWQRRYYDFNVYTAPKHIEKLQYMHRNPVKRGLATAPQGWKWSSFRHYATGEIRTVEIESLWRTAKTRGAPRPALSLPKGLASEMWDRDRAAANTHVSNARRGAPSFSNAESENA